MRYTKGEREAYNAKQKLIKEERERFSKFMSEHGWKEYGEEELKEMLTFANAAASIVTTRKGALRVMPQKEEVEALLAERTK